PLANRATSTPVPASNMAPLDTKSARRQVEVADTQPAWEVALEAALPILRKDGLKAAVQLLKQGLQKAQGGRARFFWQFALARLCFVAKKYELAKAQLETLDQMLQESGLHAW
ncbi:type VI secretion system domain-containing protein, partial [Pseudomonas viridiflava]|uniref:type VI secretion system domain-containing protein n=1 Tax=Pseudomonas viridiflava TaxID=33069 RepID=UPI0019D1E5AE